MRRPVKILLFLKFFFILYSFFLPSFLLFLRNKTLQRLRGRGERTLTRKTDRWQRNRKGQGRRGREGGGKRHTHTKIQVCKGFARQTFCVKNERLSVSVLCAKPKCSSNNPKQYVKIIYINNNTNNNQDGYNDGDDDDNNNDNYNSNINSTGNKLYCPTTLFFLSSLFLLPSRYIVCCCRWTMLASRLIELRIIWLVGWLVQSSIFSLPSSFFFFCLSATVIHLWGQKKYFFLTRIIISHTP